MKTVSWIATCLLAGSAAAQLPPAEMTTVPFDDVGTLELVSGVLTPPAPGGSLAATSGVIYNNTCLPYGAAAPTGCGFVYINSVPVGNTFIDDGRIPSFNSPAPNQGILNAYRITAFNFIYYTDEVDPSLGGPGARMSILFWPDYDRCTNMTASAAPLRTFNLNLPGTLSPGNIRGVNINISLAGGLEFTMAADANGTYDALGTLDTFGYGYQVTTLTAGATIDIVRAGEPTGVNPCAVGDGTYYKNPGTAAGTGLANNNTFWQQQSPTVGLCITGATSGLGCTGVSGGNWGGFHMKITADVDDCNANRLPDFDDIAGGTSLDTNLDGIPDECQGVAVSVYCTAGTTANSCVASISATGNPSVSAASGFIVNVNNVEGQKQGIIFYGVTAAIGNPWATGSSSFLCVKSPTQRTGTQNSGGTLNGCDGLMTLDLFSYLSTHPTALGNPFSAGNVAYFQGWFRDPPSPKTTSLSDGLAVTFQP
jgi:hypothetical protein